jgi:hypothetical protein
MAAHAADQIEEEAADLQFPKGNCIFMRSAVRRMYWIVFSFHNS